jgi:hypothetical protein
MLTAEQRAELDALSPETVRLKLLLGGADPGAAVHGFVAGPYRAFTRSDVESWLAEKNAQEATERQQTLRWAITAGDASIASVVIGAIGVGVSIAAILVAIWLAK